MLRRRLPAFLRRWVQRPLATVVLLCLLGLSVWCLPKDFRSGSIVGECIGSTLWGRPEVLPSGPTYLARAAGGFVVASDEQQRRLWSGNAFTTDAASFIAASSGVGTGREGFYALTSEVERGIVYLEPVAPSWSGPVGQVPTTDIQPARRAYLQWLSEQGGRFADEARQLEAGDFTIHRTLWLGYVHNTAALTVLGLLISSFPWIPRAVRRAIARNRLRAGLCPRCSYPTAGLPARKCPECGAEW